MVDIPQRIYSEQDVLNGVFDPDTKSVRTSSSKSGRASLVDNQVVLQNTTETTILPAAGAGIFVDITKVIITNDSATGVRVDFRDAATGQVEFSIYCPATDTRGISCGEDPILQEVANQAWTAQLSANATSVRVFMQGKKATQ